MISYIPFLSDLQRNQHEIREDIRKFEGPTQTFKERGIEHYATSINKEIIDYDDISLNMGCWRFYYTYRMDFKLL